MQNVITTTTILIYTGDSDEKLYWDGYDAFAQTSDARKYLVNRQIEINLSS